MATIDWPASLPCPISDSFEEALTPSYVDDSAQVGAPRRRKRFTRTLARYAFDLHLTSAERTELLTFIRTTTDGGTDIFNWQNPFTGEVIAVRFSELPAIRRISAGSWRASISLDEQ